jgi:hypothetical protein
MLGGQGLNQILPSLTHCISITRMLVKRSPTSSTSRLSSESTNTGSKMDIDTLAPELLSDRNATTTHQILVPRGAHGDLYLLVRDTSRILTVSHCTYPGWESGIMVGITLCQY